MNTPPQRRAWVLRWVALLAASLGSGACSHAARLAAGPALGYVRNAERAPGAELLAREAAGTSDGRSFPAVEVAARLLATEKTQVLSAGIGPAWFRSFGRAFLALDGTALLGLERFDERALALGTLRASVGGGFAFRQTSYTIREYSIPEVRVAPSSFVQVTRERTAFTLELSSGMDAPFTRAPQFSLGLLLGIAWLDETYTTDAGPPLGTPLLFRTP